MNVKQTKDKWEVKKTRREQLATDKTKNSCVIQ